MPISDRTLVLIALEEYFRRDRSGECGKVPYRSSSEAMSALAQVRGKRRVKRTAERRTYRCRHCGAFHLTSKSR